MVKFSRIRANQNKRPVIFILSVLIILESMLYFVWHYEGASIYFSRMIGFLFILFLAPALKIPKFIYIFTIYFWVQTIIFLLLFPEQKFEFLFREWILFYWIFLLIIVPVTVVRTESEFRYFIKIILYGYRILVAVAFVEFLVRVFLDVDILSRHLYDMVDVGRRLHGFFGEPRDAAVILTFVLFVELMWSNHVKQSWVNGAFKVVIYGAAVGATQSFSFVIGLLLFLAFSVVFLLPIYRRQVIFTFLLVFAVGFLFFHTPRVLLYVSSIESDLINVMTGSWEDLSPVFVGQIPNLFPIFVFVERFFEYDFGLFFFGSGFGSVRYLISQGISLSTEYLNPPSNISRWLVDFGLIGTLFMIWLFSGVIGLGRRTDSLSRLLVIASAWLCLFCALAQRSFVLFLILGICYLVKFFEENRRELRTDESVEH